MNPGQRPQYSQLQTEPFTSMKNVLWLLWSKTKSKSLLCVSISLIKLVGCLHHWQHHTHWENLAALLGHCFPFVRSCVCAILSPWQRWLIQQKPSRQTWYQPQCQLPFYHWYPGETFVCHGWKDWGLLHCVSYQLWQDRVCWFQLQNPQQS